jgi:hypothetical protein
VLHVLKVHVLQVHELQVHVLQVHELQVLLVLHEHVVYLNMLLMLLHMLH